MISSPQRQDTYRSINEQTLDAITLKSWFTQEILRIWHNARRLVDSGQVDLFADSDQQRSCSTPIYLG